MPDNVANPGNACSAVAETAWIQLIRAHRKATSTVERALRAADLPPLEWYDVLLELERGGPLRSRDLQDRLFLAQYNLSRLLDRMESQGLISRERCPDDARCQWLKSTADGQALRRRMWPIYSAAIEDAVGAKLGAAEAETLSTLLRKVSGNSVSPELPGSGIIKAELARKGRSG